MKAPVAQDMDPDDLETFLSQFGIKRHRYDGGQVGWTIDVVANNGNAQTQSAFLDEQRARWILQQPPEEEISDGQLIHSNFPGPESDWTNAFPASDFSKVVLDFDWAATPLGSLQEWPRSLQLYTQMLLSDVRPAWIYWGPERIAIYNEASLPLIGAMHPRLMGGSFEKELPYLWEYFGPLFDAVEKGGHGFARHGLELPTARNGYLEETWWDGGLVPLKDCQGRYGGSHFSWTEVTRTTLRDRRTNLINRLGLSSLTSISSFWQHVHEVFQENPRDIPLAAIYSTDENHPSSGQLHREYTIGLGDAHEAAPCELNLAVDPEDSNLVSLLYRAQSTLDDYLIIDLAEETTYATMLRDVDWLGFGEPSRYCAVIPLRDKLVIRGFVVIGLNPRRGLDEDHKQFITDLARQLTDTLIRTILRSELRVREEFLTTELGISEKRASRMAEIVPVGIYELAADGSLHWANNQFFEIMGVPRGHRQKETFSWTDHIHPEDHDRANEKMGRCLLQGIEISDTLRLRRDWVPPGSDVEQNPATEPFWVMYSALPNLMADGSTSSLTGSITDISHLKWAEQLQLRNAEAAQKERRTQEEFIDITSHEMRNPLSAITQSADGILLSLQESKTIEDLEAAQAIIKLNAEAAKSILFCAAHQRRIIDDVLTLGKLDSKLLTISPAKFRLDDLLDQALQMFKAEFEANDIEVQTSVDPSPHDAVAEESLAFQGDCSRLLQVLVNLMTNAIKFTRTQSSKRISVRCGSSHSVPSTGLFGKRFRWHCTGLPRPDLTQDPEYGQGNQAYIYFAVADSGEGIPSDALERIFTEFEQADRRTHTKYGGSGLGLYISRELTELQGGCVGIGSEVGVGSTFAFYTKVRSLLTHVTQYHLKTDFTQPVPKTVGVADMSISKEHAPGNAISRTKYKILLVEDNLLNQAVLAKQLRRVGCDVQVSSNGGEAVDMMLQKYGQSTRYNSTLPEKMLSHFDCILMDWEMPVCDGLQATRLIRNIELEQTGVRSLIIGITANARAEQVLRAKAAGMDEVVPKPFRVAELLATISGFVDP